MGVWNVNATTDLIASLAQSTFITETNSAANLAAVSAANGQSEYAKILAEKIAEVNAQGNNAQGNSANNSQSQQGTATSDENSMSMLETLRRIMPDGSLRIVTYKDGDVISQLKISPNMVMVPDYSAPPDPTGNDAMKPEYRLGLAALLMT